MGAADAEEVELGLSVCFSVIYVVSFLLWLKASAKITRILPFGPLAMQGAEI